MSKNGFAERGNRTCTPLFLGAHTTHCATRFSASFFWYIMAQWVGVRTKKFLEKNEWVRFPRRQDRFYSFFKIFEFKNFKNEQSRFFQRGNRIIVVWHRCLWNFSKKMSKNGFADLGYRTYTPTFLGERTTHCATKFLTLFLINHILDSQIDQILTKKETQFVSVWGNPVKAAAYFDETATLIFDGRPYYGKQGMV